MITILNHYIRLMNKKIGNSSLKLSGVLILSFVCLEMGCAKKSGNTDYSSEVYRNGSGATVVDGAKAHSASLYSEANGVQVDIMNLKKIVQTTGSVTIESTLQIGNQVTLPLFTTHYNLGVIVGRVSYQDLTFETTAQCANYACDRYFLVIDVLRDGALIVQQAVRHDFFQPINSRYQWLKPEDRMSFASLVSLLGGY